MPARIIISIGWIFSCFLPNLSGKYARQNATAHMAMFIHICLVMPFGLKLAAFISMIAADAIRPTTTGRKPENTAFTAPLSLCRRMKCAL